MCCSYGVRLACICVPVTSVILQKLELGGRGPTTKKTNRHEFGGGGGRIRLCLHQQYVSPAHVVNVVVFVLVLCVMSAVLNRCAPAGQGKMGKCTNV